MFNIPSNISTMLCWIKLIVEKYLYLEYSITQTHSIIFGNEIIDVLLLPAFMYDYMKKFDNLDLLGWELMRPPCPNRNCLSGYMKAIYSFPSYTKKGSIRDVKMYVMYCTWGKDCTPYREWKPVSIHLSQHSNAVVINLGSAHNWRCCSLLKVVLGVDRQLGFPLDKQQKTCKYKHILLIHLLFGHISWRNVFIMLQCGPPWGHS